VAANKEGCELTIRPANFDELMGEYDVDTHTITVDAGKGDFEVAAEEAGFTRVTPEIAEDYGGTLRAGTWAAFGRGSSREEAAAIRRGTSHGLRADDVDAGCHHLHGGYAGLCRMRLAFLTDGKRYVTIEGSSAETYDDVIASLHLSRPPKAGR
jgi:hypothetical protein